MADTNTTDPMDNPQDNGRTFARREMLHGAARLFLVGGLFTYFVHQRKRSLMLTGDGNCVKLETCSDCIEFGGCDLPKSHDHRAHLQQENDQRAT